MPSGSPNPAPLQAPESHISFTATSADSSAVFAAATSRTRSAIVSVPDAGAPRLAVRVGRHHRERDVARLVLDPVVPGEFGFRSRPSTSP